MVYMDRAWYTWTEGVLGHQNTCYFFSCMEIQILIIAPWGIREVRPFSSLSLPLLQENMPLLLEIILRTSHLDKLFFPIFAQVPYVLLR